MLPKFNKNFTEPSNTPTPNSFGGSLNKQQFSETKKSLNLNSLLAIIAFILVIVSYIGVFGYSFYLKNVIEAKSQELSIQRESFKTDLIRDIVYFSSSGAAVAKVLESRAPTVSLLDEFNSLVVPGVSFSSFLLKRESDNAYQVVLSGVAPSLPLYLQQLHALNSNDTFRNGATVEFSIREGDVFFTYEIKSNLSTLKSAAESLQNSRQGNFSGLFADEELEELEDPDEIQDDLDESESQENSTNNLEDI